MKSVTLPAQGNYSLKQSYIFNKNVAYDYSKDDHYEINLANLIPNRLKNLTTSFKNIFTYSL